MSSFKTLSGNNARVFHNEAAAAVAAGLHLTPAEDVASDDDSAEYEAEEVAETIDEEE